MTWTEAGIIGSVVSLVTVMVNAWIGRSTKRKSEAEAVKVKADTAAKIEETCGNLMDRVNVDNEKLYQRCVSLQRRLDEQQDQMDELERKLEAADHCQSNLESKIREQDRIIQELNRRINVLTDLLKEAGCEPPRWNPRDNI